MLDFRHIEVYLPIYYIRIPSDKYVILTKAYKRYQNVDLKIS